MLSRLHHHLRHLWLERRDDDRGATLAIVALCVAILLPTALAFSIELGEDTVVNRSLQSAADAGALDAARYINVSSNDVQTYGVLGVQHNYPGATSQVTQGNWSSTTPWVFPSSCSLTQSTCFQAVQVTASSSVKHISEAGYAALQRSAIAYVTAQNGTQSCTMPCSPEPNGPNSGLSIGTTLASLQTADVPVLDNLLDALGVNANISLLGYQGLAATNVSVQNLIDASGGVLTPSNVISASDPALLPPSYWAYLLNEAVQGQASVLACPSATVPVCNAEASLAAYTQPSSTTCTAPQASAPTVTNVTPNMGGTAGGTAVTISGTGFSGVTSVDFGTNAATNVAVNSSTSITATSPPGTVGNVDVTVSEPTGTSATSYNDVFTYTNGPTVASVSPNNGAPAGGTSVAITGSNFGGVTTVDFGGTTASSFTYNSSTSIMAVSPAGTVGTVDVTVTTTNGTSATSGSDQFTYDGRPAISSVNPVGGPTAGGTSVAITGTNLNGATAVDFGDVAASSFTVNSATSITAASAAGTAGTIDITVTSPGGTSAAVTADHFTYEAAPTISSLVSTGLTTATGSTAGGTSVTITGTNFVPADSTTTVSFGGNAATSVDVISSTEITVTSPAGSAGSVNVTVSDAGGTSNAKTFTYGPPPTITSVTGLDILGTSNLTINGTNFNGTVAVDLGSSPASSFTVVSNTKITATSSSPLSILGSLDATVITPYGSASYGLGSLLAYVVPANQGSTAVLISDVHPLARATHRQGDDHGRDVQLVRPAAPVTLADALETVARVTHADNHPADDSTTSLKYQLVDDVSGSTCMSLCQFLSINGSTCSSGSVSQPALAADLNVLSSLTTLAELANGQSGLDLTSTVNLQGVTANLLTTVVQPPRTAYGPVGTTVSSTQLNVELQLSISIVGLGVATVNIPITGASGTATLTEVDCDQNTMTTTQIQASTTAMTGAVTMSLANGAPSQIATVTVSGAPSTPLTYDNPTNAPSATWLAVSEAAGTNPQSIGTTSPSITLSGESIPPLEQAVISTLLQEVGNEFSSTIAPVIGSLGLSLANAVVTDLSYSCSPVELAP